MDKARQSKFKIWLASSRPKTLPAALGPVMIGGAFAYVDGVFNWLVLGATALAAVLIQVGTNYANDYYDYIKGADTEHRVGPVRATQAGLVEPGRMKAAFIITFALAIGVGVYLVFKGGPAIMLIGLVSIVCGILYTAGPYPLGYNGLGDLFVLIFFGPVAVGGTYYLQTRGFNGVVFAAGLAPGLMATAILTVNNFRDYHTDKAAGKKSLVVRFGRRFGIAEYIFCVAGACMIPTMLSFLTGSHYTANLALLTLVAAIHPVKTICTTTDPDRLNKLLARTGLLLLVLSVLFSIGWIL